MDSLRWPVLILIFSFLASNLRAASIISWNLKDFGNSKSDSELNFIAETIKDFDIVAIQEVVAGDGGALAVARLADVLNRKGAKWDYIVSPPTYSSNYKTERYAFLWKTFKVKRIGDPWLEQTYKVEIDREPFYMTFKEGAFEFTLVNFHAITKSRQPETEIKYFKALPGQYAALNLIFCGDFNLPQSHAVFNPLKSAGYRSVLLGQETSLRETCLNNDCLASEFDNIFYNSQKIKLLASGVVHFYKGFVLLENARLISDHIPVWAEMDAVNN